MTVALSSKKFLQDIHDKPARLLTKFEKAVEDKLGKSRERLGPRPSTVSPRSQQFQERTQMTIEESSVEDSNFVEAFKIRDEKSSLEKALLTYMWLWKSSHIFHRLIRFQAKGGTDESSNNVSHPSNVQTKFEYEVNLIQKWYRRKKSQLNLHTSSEVITAFLQALKRSLWCKLRAFRFKIIRCQRIVRSFLSCTAQRLHALNIRWQRIQNAALSKKLRQFVPKSTRYYLLLDWLRKARKQFVISSIRYEEAVKSGVTSFATVDEQQVKRFLHSNKSGQKRLSMHIPQLVVSIDESMQRPRFMIYTRDLLEDDIKHMIQRAMRITPKDLQAKELQLLTQFIPDMQNHKPLVETVISVAVVTSTRRKVPTLPMNDSLGGSRTEVASLIRAVNKLVQSRRYSK